MSNEQFPQHPLPEDFPKMEEQYKPRVDFNRGLDQSQTWDTVNFEGLNEEEIYLRAYEELEQRAAETRNKMGLLIKEADAEARRQIVEGYKELEKTQKSSALQRIFDKVLGVRKISPEEYAVFADGDIREMIAAIENNPQAIKEYEVRSRVSITIADSIHANGEIEDLISLIVISNPKNWPNDFFKDRVFGTIKYYCENYPDTDKSRRLQEVLK